MSSRPIEDATIGLVSRLAAVESSLETSTQVVANRLLWEKLGHNRFPNAARVYETLSLTSIYGYKKLQYPSAG